MSALYASRTVKVPYSLVCYNIDLLGLFVVITVDVYANVVSFRELKIASDVCMISSSPDGVNSSVIVVALCISNCCCCCGRCSGDSGGGGGCVDNIAVVSSSINCIISAPVVVGIVSFIVGLSVIVATAEPIHMETLYNKNPICHYCLRK